MPKRRSADPRFSELTKEIDVEQFRDSIPADFADFPDPRRETSIKYPAWCILFVVLSGYLAGGNNLGDVAHFAELREDWLKDLLGIDRVPCYDTIWWFLVRTDPKAFQALIRRWLRSLPKDLQD